MLFLIYLQNNTNLIDMSLPKDPFMLLSVVNTKLRDEYASPAELCAAMDEDLSMLNKRLADSGFTYDASQNRYR